MNKNNYKLKAWLQKFCSKDGNCGMQLGFICEKFNTNQTNAAEFVQPLSFGDGNICPIGYSTFGGMLSF